MIVIINISTLWMPFSIIKTWHYDIAEPSNIGSLAVFIQYKLIYLAIWCTLPTIALFIDQYSHATGRYSSIIHLQIQCLVKLHNELGDNTLTHSVLLFFDPLNPPCFHYIDLHQRLFNLLLWLSYRPNQSMHIRCGTHTPRLRGFWILKAVVQFYCRWTTLVMLRCGSVTLHAALWH